MLPTILSKIVYNFDFEFTDANLYQDDVHVVASAKQNFSEAIQVRIKSAPFQINIALRNLGDVD
jgi:hypothetical protein